MPKQRPQGQERRQLVLGLLYLPVQRSLLAVLRPGLAGAVERMRKPEVLAQLLSPECGTMDELRAAVSVLKMQAAELRQQKAAKKSSKRSGGALKGRANKAARVRRGSSSSEEAEDEGEEHSEASGSHGGGACGAAGSSGAVQQPPRRPGMRPRRG